MGFLTSIHLLFIKSMLKYVREIHHTNIRGLESYDASPGLLSGVARYIRSDP